MVFVTAGCVSGGRDTDTVDETVCVIGALVLAGAVTVSVVSCVCTMVAWAAIWPDDEVAAEPELPSTATTEYEARLATGEDFRVCKGRAGESTEKERIRRAEGSIGRILSMQRYLEMLVNFTADSEAQAAADCCKVLGYDGTKFIAKRRTLE